MQVIDQRFEIDAAVYRFGKEKVKWSEAVAVTHVCNSSGLSTSSKGSVNAVVGSSITNLRCMDGEPSDMTANFPPVDPSTPGEPYLAPRYILLQLFL